MDIILFSERLSTNQVSLVRSTSIYFRGVQWDAARPFRCTSA